jgi:hypothetical protein
MVTVLCCCAVLQQVNKTNDAYQGRLVHFLMEGCRGGPHLLISFVFAFYCFYVSSEPFCNHVCLVSWPPLLAEHFHIIPILSYLIFHTCSCLTQHVCCVHV